MRIFIALDIDEVIRERIVRFMEGVRGFAPNARWVRPESLHVTLKFIGEKSLEAVEEIKGALAGTRGKSFAMRFRGYGFFPTANAARVFWLGIEADAKLSELARAVDDATATLGIPREEHSFQPHLTLARGAGRSGAPRRQKDDAPNRAFRELQLKLAAFPSPEFGTMTAREFSLYESELQRGGSRYTKLAGFPLV